MRITKDYKKYIFESYDSAIEAAYAYDFYAKQLHGKFATYNFPETEK